MSTDQKVTRRRDDDPVRVHPDGRVAWWTGDKPGVDDRTIARKGTRENTEAYAEELRAELRRDPYIRGPKDDATPAEMVQDRLHALRAEHTAEGHGAAVQVRVERPHGRQHRNRALPGGGHLALPPVFSRCSRRGPPSR